MDAGAQDGQRRLGGDAVQRLVVRGVEDILRFAELAQVDAGGGEREQRLDMAGIGGDPGAVAGRRTEQLEPVADLAVVPAEDRAGDQGRRGGVAVVLAGGGQDRVGYRPGELVAQPGQGLQVRGHRLVPQVIGQLRDGQHHRGLGGGVPGLAAGAQDRGQSAPQPGLGHGRQRRSQCVPGDPGGLLQPAGRGQRLGGGHRAGQRARIGGTCQLQRTLRQVGCGLRSRTQRLRRRPVKIGQRGGVTGMRGLEQVTRGQGR